MTITLDQTRAIALLTSGLASEVQNHSSFKLGWAMTYKADGTPANNSGYSVGFLQSDLGQRSGLVPDLVSSFYAWAGTDPSRIISRSQEDLTAALSQQGKPTIVNGVVLANGLVGNADSTSDAERPPSADEQARFNAFL